jgi:hypothetical protein
MRLALCFLRHQPFSDKLFKRPFVVGALFCGIDHTVCGKNTINVRPTETLRRNRGDQVTHTNGFI